MRSILVISCLLLLSFALGICLGSEGWLGFPAMNSQKAFILWNLRIPRSLLAFFVGGGLGLAGLIFQSIFRNSLAGPFTLGVASGASFGACLGIYLSTSMGVFFSIGMFSSVSFLSFSGALLSVFIILSLSRLKRAFSPTTLILCGVVTSFFFSSLILLLQFLSAQYDAKKMLQWIMGDLGVVGLESVALIASICILLMIYTWKRAGVINIIAVGETFAYSKGIQVDKELKFFFVLTSCLVGVIVSVTGPISFVGLIIPHLVKSIYGIKFEKNLLPCFFIAGSFLLFCDSISRLLDFGSGLPVGIITSLIGGPYFLYILLREKSL